MDLKSFVAVTLNQIIAGVKEAQTETRKHGGAINPRYVIYRGDQVHAAPEEIIQDVQFDVALTVEEQTTTDKAAEAGAAVKVFGIVDLKASGSGGKENQSINSTVSRVQFKVRVCLPHAPEG